MSNLQTGLGGRSVTDEALSRASPGNPRVGDVDIVAHAVGSGVDPAIWDVGCGPDGCAIDVIRPWSLDAFSRHAPSSVFPALCNLEGDEIASAAEEKVSRWCVTRMCVKTASFRDKKLGLTKR